MKAYSFKKFLHDEIHIFEGDLHPDGSCHASPRCLCNGIRIGQGRWFEEMVCLERERALRGMQLIGSRICPECAKALR